MPHTIALTPEECETFRTEVLGSRLIVESNFAAWGPPSPDEFAALREQLDRWVPALERLERDGEISASLHVIAAVRERLETVRADQYDEERVELASYLARLLERLEAAGAVLDVQPTRNDEPAEGSLAYKTNVLLEYADRQLVFEGAHSVAGRESLSERELDFIDWGTFFGVAYAIARLENPLVDPWTLMARAMAAARQISSHLLERLEESGEVTAA